MDSVAVALSNELDQLGTKSFVSSNNSSPKRKAIQQKLDVVLRIIEVREAENARALAAKKNTDRREKLLEALEAKKEEALTKMSEEELQEQLAQLDAVVAN